LRVGLAAACVLLVATGCFRVSAQDSGYEWKLPKGFPKPYVPADNPMTAAKVELGRYLFYDTRLSVNGTQSCASCHRQELAFTDGRAVGIGATGERHTRGAMSLVNVSYSGALTWNNPGIRSLEQQALVPMFAEHPVELGLAGDRFLTLLRAESRYAPLFARAFPGEPDAYTVGNVTRAIASFERSIISGRSPFDRYHYDRDEGAVSESAKRGEVLFFSQHISCFRCHSGFNFSDATVSEKSADRSVEFHNTGLYDLTGVLSYTAPNVGAYEFTRESGDLGKFRTPTLRNVALTAPYMHDGSIATLEGVLDHYAAGGRAHDAPNKDHLIGGFTMTQGDRRDLVEYLKSLTDEQVIHDPRFANPWPTGTRPR
jgi:cytochrome c peroxidase